jgi:alkanesulfonate monooxygenase SsuD/methylene tetrahydromethanopterin reductase-like flavin-dependent oxidoreductase (luciferase family)
VSFVGTAATIEQQIEQFLKQTRADELIVASAIYDHNARLRSYEIAAQFSLPA